jgi:hypothetical protein
MKAALLSIGFLLPLHNCKDCEDEYSRLGQMQVLQNDHE